jgi:hypothetical protein
MAINEKPLMAIIGNRVAIMAIMAIFLITK